MILHPILGCSRHCSFISYPFPFAPSPGITFSRRDHDRLKRRESSRRGNSFTIRSPLFPSDRTAPIPAILLDCDSSNPNPNPHFLTLILILRSLPPAQRNQAIVHCTHSTLAPAPAWLAHSWWSNFLPSSFSLAPGSWRLANLV